MQGNEVPVRIAYLWLSIHNQLEFKKLRTDYGRLKDDGLNARRIQKISIRMTWYNSRDQFSAFFD